MLRIAVVDDLPAILSLYRQLQPDDQELDHGLGEERFGEIQNLPNVELYVLEQTEQVVATAYLNVVPNLTRQAAPYAFIENVVVDEQCRRSGLGRLMVQAVIDRAWELGCYKVMLMSGREEPEVRDFYLACGFDGDSKAAFVIKP